MHLDPGFQASRLLMQGDALEQLLDVADGRRRGGVLQELVNVSATVPCLIHVLSHKNVLGLSPLSIGAFAKLLRIANHVYSRTPMDHFSGKGRSRCEPPAATARIAARALTVLRLHQDVIVLPGHGVAVCRGEWVRFDTLDSPMSQPRGQCVL